MIIFKTVRDLYKNLREIFKNILLFKPTLEYTVRVQTQSGGGLEHFHRSPWSRKRRRKGNTVSDETVMYGYWSSVT
jgi:hypothetical protein